MIAHAGAGRAAGVTFIPLVMESLGGWSEEAIQTIKSIGRLQGQRLGIPPPETTRHLFQRLAISLWKGNASLWVRRQPACSAIVDIYISIHVSIYRDSAAVESTSGVSITLASISIYCDSVQYTVVYVLLISMYQNHIHRLVKSRKK